LFPLKVWRTVPRKLQIVLNRIVQRMRPTLQHAMINEKKVLESISGDLILDCGCGIGRWGFLIKSLMPTKKIVGVEADKTYLLPLRKTKYYDFIVQTDIAYLPFKAKSFDTILAIEVIEHQTKTLGINFLKYVDEVAKCIIILTTPQGFLNTTRNETHKFENHKSGWHASELEQFGYVVSEFEWHGLRWLFAVKQARMAQVLMIPKTFSDISS